MKRSSSARRYHTADIAPVELITRDEPGIVVTRTSYAATTRYHMAGLAELVHDEVEQVKRRYPTGGYGTWATPPKYLAPGKVAVIVDRSNCCD